MPVELTRNGAAAVITLNRPEALNALSFEVVGERNDYDMTLFTKLDTNLRLD